MAAALAATACARAAIRWEDPVPLSPALSASEELAFNAADSLVPRIAPPVSLPVFTAQCSATARVSGDSASGWFAAWWAVNLDSTADLVLSHSADGINWSPTMRVDSTDVARTGCTRMPPAVFVDGQNVHVAYAMTASEGPGIFVSHSMDSGMTFHTPVAIAYGEQPGRVAVAARGDLVAVAYEDPNSSPSRIAVAISRVAGHGFEAGIIASPPAGEAHEPGIALGNGLIAVTWSSGPASNASAPRIVRVGTLR